MRALLCTLPVLCMAFVAYSQTPAKLNANEPTPDCSQPPKACEKPVKWLADKKDCSCFACEYGKPGLQHTICTSNKDSKFALLKLSELDGSELASYPSEEANGMVWVNTATKTYHKAGYAWYGKTKQGKYMTEADATKAGYKEEKGTKMVKKDHDDVQK